MTDAELLDHFAGCALTGIAVSDDDLRYGASAAIAYSYATAMMAERKKHMDIDKSAVMDEMEKYTAPLVATEPARLECMREKCKWHETCCKSACSRADRVDIYEPLEVKQ